MKALKKDIVFFVLTVAVAVLLFLFRFTGVVPHIALSVVGLALLVVYAVMTKKSWKLPALEIVMRVFYGISLILGGVIMGVDLAPLAIAHKVFAALFAVLFVVLFVHKAVTANKE